MTNTIYLNNDPTAVKLAAAAFPGYSGRKYRLCVTDAPQTCHSYWDDGSRDYYALVNLADMRQVGIPQNGSGFEATLPPVPMVPGVAILKHSIYRSADLGITIYLHPDNATALLPAPTELTTFEKIVLVATRSLKSSYAGVSNYRFVEAKRETGITAEEWDTAKAALISRGLLNKAGAITDTGRNAAGSSDLYRLRESLGRVTSRY